MANPPSTIIATAITAALALTSWSHAFLFMMPSLRFELCSGLCGVWKRIEGRSWVEGPLPRRTLVGHRLVTVEKMSVERRNVPELASPPGYTHVAIARGTTLVFTAGAVPLDASGELVGVDDPVTQTDQVVANLIAALTAAGARPDDVVKTTVYVAGATTTARRPCGRRCSVHRSRRRRARWWVSRSWDTEGSSWRSRPSRSSTTDARLSASTSRGPAGAGTAAATRGCWRTAARRDAARSRARRP